MNTEEKEKIAKRLKTYPASIAAKRNAAKRRYAEGDALMEEADRMQADYENLKKQAQ